MLKTNYHTHTTFCDGNATPQAMADAAIARGFAWLGFSGHSMYPFSNDWHIASREHAAYAKEVRRVAAACHGSIEILLGFEADFIEGVCCPTPEQYAAFQPDFLIGSVHYVPGSRGFIEADGASNDVLVGIERHFGGDSKKAVQEYFYLERQMLRAGRFAIMGHPDLIRKQNSPRNPRPLFCEQDAWYKEEIKLLAKEITAAGVCVEINTGGMARGYMESPFPSAEFLALLHERNVPVTISADAHAPEHLDCAYQQALRHAAQAGYTELAYFTAGGAMQMQPLLAE